MTTRLVLEGSKTARTVSCEWDGKKYSAKDVWALDKVLDEAGCPRPRTIRGVG